MVQIIKNASITKNAGLTGTSNHHSASVGRLALNGTTSESTPSSPKLEVSPNLVQFVTDYVASMRAADVSDKAIAAGMKMLHRAMTSKHGNLVLLILIMKRYLLKETSGRRFATGEMVGTLLVKAGCYRIKAGPGWAGVGDALGRLGHQLPNITHAKKRYFDLPCIGMTPKAKEDRQRELDDKRPSSKELKKLIAVIKDTTNA